MDNVFCGVHATVGHQGVYTFVRGGVQGSSLSHVCFISNPDLGV